jgi:prepilin-type N-terminal cleavage/methylation domain-containing protein
MSKRHRGFSLVEASVVLVIVALIVALITEGRRLSYLARTQRIINEAAAFQGAIINFNSQYGALPGDMDNAYKYWGANCDAVEADCNGDADGYIEYRYGDGTVKEGFRAWQHMALAGFIPGTYTGEGSGTDHQSVIGTNCPISEFGKQSGWSLNHTSNTYSWPTYNFAVTGNFMEFGAYNSNNPTTTNVLTPSQAKTIDFKTDDGLPYKGQIIGDTNGGTCVSSSAYVGTSTTVGCILYFFLLVGFE